jgi:hypothetical protein
MYVFPFSLLFLLISHISVHHYPTDQSQTGLAPHSSCLLTQWLCASMRRPLVCRTALPARTDHHCRRLSEVSRVAPRLDTAKKLTKGATVAASAIIPKSAAKIPDSLSELDGARRGEKPKNEHTTLFSGHRVSYRPFPFGSRSGVIGPIPYPGCEMCGSARSAGNPHAMCEMAGAGNRHTVRLVRHFKRKRGETDKPHLAGGNSARPRP